MSKKPTKPKSAKPAGQIVIMFGLDKELKPHAARFVGENDALLTKAAAVMGMRLAVPITSKQLEITKTLPVGRIHGTGNGLIPIIEQKLYDQITSLVGGEVGLISSSLPKSWTELVPGHLVLAQDNLADGWWEAIITKKAADAVTLKWRDYPGQPEFVRPVSAVALLRAG